jgi:hypothetical protein
MDNRQFDEIARSIGATRRGAVGLLAGGLGLLVAAAPDWAAGKKRKRKKKRKKIRCHLNGHTCLPSTPHTCCLQGCCLGQGQPEGGQHYCTSSRNTCCIAEHGGGACPPEYPWCCEDGSCGETLEACYGLLDGGGRVPRLTVRG